MKDEWDTKSNEAELRSEELAVSDADVSSPSPNIKALIPSHFYEIILKQMYVYLIFSFALLHVNW